MRVLFPSSPVIAQRTKTHSGIWFRGQRKGRNISYSLDSAEGGCRWSTGDYSQFSHASVVNVFVPAGITLNFRMNLPNFHTAPTEHVHCASEPFQLCCALWNSALREAALQHLPLFSHFCWTETHATIFPGWKLAVYSTSQFPIHWRTFSMTELYVLHSMPLNIHFWETVKIFALTA